MAAVAPYTSKFFLKSHMQGTWIETSWETAVETQVGATLISDKYPPVYRGLETWSRISLVELC